MPWYWPWAAAPRPPPWKYHYQALKYDFNIPEALTLAWTQLLIAGGLFVVLNRLGKVTWMAPDMSSQPRLPRSDQLMRLLHYLLYGLLWLVLLAHTCWLCCPVYGRWTYRWQALSILQPLLVTLGLGVNCARDWRCSGVCGPVTGAAGAQAGTRTPAARPGMAGDPYPGDTGTGVVGGPVCVFSQAH
ncbi:MAG: hypothetical protein R3E95_03375 [Thiolinea sp.]